MAPLALSAGSIPLLQAAICSMTTGSWIAAGKTARDVPAAPSARTKISRQEMALRILVSVYPMSQFEVVGLSASFMR